MLSRTFGLTALLLPLCCFSTSGQTPRVRAIQIKSNWGGLGTWGKTELTVSNHGRSFRVGHQVLDSSLVERFCSSLGEPVVPQPELSNLGVTQDWLNRESEKVPPYYFIGRSPASTAQRRLFTTSFTNLETIGKLMPNLFHFSRTDDYPSVEVQVTFEDGSVTQVASDSQYVFMLPWEITKGGCSSRTFNADISRALAAMLPKKCANRGRIAGQSMAEELAEAVRRYIDDDWNLIDAESIAGDSLVRLRAQYTVQRADINSFHHPEYGMEWKKGRPQETNLHVDLRKTTWPTNFTEHVVLLDRDGKIIGAEELLARAGQYEARVFGVSWLNRYIQNNPRVPFRLSFVHSTSLGDKAMRTFTADMKKIGKGSLADEIRAQQQQISLLLVGMTYSEAYWLVLSDNRVVLWRYGGRSGLLDWASNDFPANECAQYQGVTGGCVGAVVTPDGALVR